MTCVRRAWLTLGALSVELEGQGYGVTDLDLGSPTVREVVENVPDGPGVLDDTLYPGGRVVSVAISALAGAGARIDEVGSMFGPFMVPSARPVLHYILDRPGEAERTLTLRASAYSWPIKGPNLREISLQWLAADPVARDPTLRSATAWAGSATAVGRSYPWRPPRIYPTGSQGPVTGQIEGAGDVPIRPTLAIFGPIQDPAVTFEATELDGSSSTYQIELVDYRIDAGHRVEIDTAAHTAYLDGDETQSVLASIDWGSIRWPVLPAAPPGSTILSLAGDNTTTSSQVVVEWRDGYLS